MDLAERLNDMMVAVGREAEIPVDIRDDNIIVTVDDFVECAIAAAKTGDAVEFRAPLFAFGADKRDRLFAEALKLNVNTEGYAVALSDRAPVLLLRRSVPAEGLHRRELSDALSEFLDATRSVRERLAEAAGAGDGRGQALRPDIDYVLLRG